MGIGVHGSMVEEKRKRKFNVEEIHLKFLWI